MQLIFGLLQEMFCKGQIFCLLKNIFEKNLRRKWQMKWKFKFLYSSVHSNIQRYMKAHYL